jgi:hypothetical protein
MTNITYSQLNFCYPTFINVWKNICPKRVYYLLSSFFGTFITSSTVYISQDVTTKAKFYSCDIEPGKSLKTQATNSAAQRSACVAETGYYMDPRQPCESYSVFGRLPSLDPGGRSVVCTRPGRLADTLGLSHQLMETTFMFIDKSMKLVIDVTKVFFACLFVCFSCVFTDFLFNRRCGSGPGVNLLYTI